MTAHDTTDGGDEDTPCDICSSGRSRCQEQVDGKNLNLCGPCRDLLVKGGRVEGSRVEVV